MKRKFAFTLAEILIVLGIVGFIAGITIPNLIANYQKNQVVTQYKKAFSEISQAIKLSEANNGAMELWDLSSYPITNGERSKKFAEIYLYPYLKTIKKCDVLEEGCWTPPKSLYGNTGYLALSSTHPTAITASGYSIHFWKSGVEDNSSHVLMWIDIDGLNKGKNMLGRDVFGIRIYFMEGTDHKAGIYPMGAGTPTPSKTRDELINDSTNGCRKFNGTYSGLYCGGLIALDGWQIADDYPWN